MNLQYSRLLIFETMKIKEYCCYSYRSNNFTKIKVLGQKSNYNALFSVKIRKFP